MDALWNALAPCDADFLAYEMLPKPDNIAPLVIADSEQWLSGGDEVIVQVESTLPSEWMTIFEFRQLSQDDPYHVPHVMHAHVRSAFILPAVVQNIGTIEESLPWEEEIEPQYAGENLTWADFQQAMSEDSPESIDADIPGVPCVAVCTTHTDFLGFHTIATFSSLVFGTVNLSFRGFEVYQGDERVGYFESWQEGYPDEDYNDRPMAYGVRFRARCSFIQQLCHEWGRAFAVRQIENRWLFKSYQREPEKSAIIKRITIIPVVKSRVSQPGGAAPSSEI